MVGMSVENHVDRVAIEGLLQAARPQVGKDLERLAFNRRPDGRVVEQADTLRRAQACKSRFELEGLLERLLYESLGGGLAPGTQGGPSKAAGEPLGPRDSGALLPCGGDDLVAGLHHGA